jgi:Transposase IS116/IS110/IS902 family
MNIEENLPELLRLNRDIKLATATLERREARYLVDTYYQMQDYRISTSNQGRSMAKDAEPHLTLDFFQRQMGTLERQVRAVLDTWTSTDPLGMWAKSITGIGPVIAAGLLAHIDIEKAPTVGHIWRYAGLDPTVTWEKGEKRPWNASLKVICWKAGESFVKVSNNKNDIYGHFYAQRKEMENERNDAVRIVHSMANVEAIDAKGRGTYVIDGNAVTCYQIHGVWYYGGNAMAAHSVLARKKIGKDTDAIKSYSVGKLPPAHIHSRAKRYAVKLFLAHYHETGYRLHYGTEPPAPYPIQHLGHVHRIPVPNPVAG